MQCSVIAAYQHFRDVMQCSVIAAYQHFRDVMQCSVIAAYQHFREPPASFMFFSHSEVVLSFHTALCHVP